MNTDRNLLLGILALQMDFISRDALIAAMNTWVLEKAKPLGQILLDQGAIRDDVHGLLVALVQKHLEQHGNDPQKSLAAVGLTSSARDDLERLGDSDVEASLNAATLLHAAGAPDRTQPRTAGESTSAGTRFRILRLHARGGLGEVYVAQDQELHREVAFKEIHQRFADDPASRSRFVLEAEVTGGLEHPGIVPVYGLGSYADGRPFYAMRFIQGDSLKEAIERFHDSQRRTRDPGLRSLELRKLLGRFIDVCNAIGYAHSRGVLHRDLKPQNIMLGKHGETLVVDWGLAKVVGRSESHAESNERTLQPASVGGSAVTVLGSAIGTPQYMSPEQAEGRLDLLGPATDVYSLGATLYCLLTGRPAFESGELADTLNKVAKGNFPPPREVKPDVPAALQAICLKGMALKPADRYASPRAFADDIEHWLADEPVDAHREQFVERSGRWLRRHRAWVRAGVAALVLVVVAVSAMAIFIDRARRAEATQADAAKKRLRESLLARGRAERLAGSRWQALASLREAAEMNPSAELRQEVIQASTSAGLRLQHAIPFGDAHPTSLSSDGEMLAIGGYWWRRGANSSPSADEWQAPMVVVYRVDDGSEVDRARMRSLMDPLDFRPNSRQLAIPAEQAGVAGVRLRNVVEKADVGFVPGRLHSFSPDGQRLVVNDGSGIQVVRAVDLKLEATRPSAKAVAFLSNQELIIEEGRDLKGWEIGTGRETFAFTAPDGMHRVWDQVGTRSVLESVVAFSMRNPKRPSNTAYALWNVRTGKEVARFDDADYGAIAVQPPFDWLVALDVKSPRQEILLYDLSRRAVAARLDGKLVSRNGQQDGCLSPSGLLFAAAARTYGQEDAIVIFDTETGQKLTTLPDNRSPLWSFDGRHLVTVAAGNLKDADDLLVQGGGRYLVNIWEVADPTPTYQLDRPIVSITADPSGKRLSANDRFWEVFPGEGTKRLRPAAIPDEADWVAFSGSGALYAARLKRDLFKQSEEPTPIWQLEPQLREVLLPSSEQVEGASIAKQAIFMALSPDGMLAAAIWDRHKRRGSGTSGNSQWRLLDIWDLSAVKQLHVLHGDAGNLVNSHHTPTSIAFSPDSRMVAVTFGGGVATYAVADGRMASWFVMREQIRPGRNHIFNAQCVTFSPDGQWICYGGEGRLAVAAADPQSGEQITGLDLLLVRQPFNLPGGVAAAADPDLTFPLPRALWKGHTGKVLAIAVSPDSRTLATGGEDRMVRLWEIPTGRSLAEWEAHEATVTALAFNPRGPTLVSGSADGTLKLWDLPAIRRELNEFGLDW